MRKISETILDFGKPIIDQLHQDVGESPPIEAMKNVLLFVISVWNAHVMATNIWGKPHHLAALREQARQWPSHLAKMVEPLSQRWHERFSDDARAVVNWDIIPDGKGGHQFQCDAWWPGTPGTA